MWFELAGMGQRFIAKQRPWCGDKLLMTKKGTVWVGSRRSEAASGAGTNVNVWTEEAKSASKSHLSHSHYIPWRPSARTFVPTLYPVNAAISIGLLRSFDAPLSGLLFVFSGHFLTSSRLFWSIDRLFSASLPAKKRLQYNIRRMARGRASVMQRLSCVIEAWDGSSAYIRSAQGGPGLVRTLS